MKSGKKITKNLEFYFLEICYSLLILLMSFNPEFLSNSLLILLMAFDPEFFANSLFLYLYLRTDLPFSAREKLKLVIFDVFKLK